MARRAGKVAAVALAILAGALALAAASDAATYTVTQTSDEAGPCDENCALREAVMAANGTPEDDRIEVPAGTYTLSLSNPDSLLGCDGDADWGDLDICRDGGALDLIGAGAKGTVVDAGGIDRVLQIYSDADAPGPPVEIQRLTLTGGRSSDEGGGLRVDRSRPTTVVRSVIRGNRTLGPLGNGPDGGGISNASELTLRKVTVRGNSSGGGGDGGGIANDNTITIDASTISGNVAQDDPGYDGDAGGLNNAGTATIVNSTFSGNRAGAANSSDGGAIYTDGDLEAMNLTIAFNSAESGGGIYSVDRPENSQTFTTSILTRNAAQTGPNCGGTGLVSLGHNLVQVKRCGFGAGDIAGNARLEPLADNGGPTRTHALGRGSQAIDATPKSTCPPVDQRGVHRPQGRRCDIGAYERRVG